MSRQTVTVEEAAEVLGLSISFTYRLIATKAIPALRFGRKILITRKTIEDFLQNPTDHTVGEDEGNA